MDNPLATAVFGASLTLVAILIGVASIFEGQIADLESRGLELAVGDTRLLRDAVVVFLMVCCWSAFWSFLNLWGKSSYEKIYTIPIMISIVGLFGFVPYWIWLR